LLKHNIEGKPPFFRILRYIVQQPQADTAGFAMKFMIRCQSRQGFQKAENILQRTRCFIANFLL